MEKIDAGLAELEQVVSETPQPGADSPHARYYALVKGVQLSLIAAVRERDAKLARLEDDLEQTVAVWDVAVRNVCKQRDEFSEQLRLADEMAGSLLDMVDAEGCESGGSPDCVCGVCLSLSSLNAYRKARGAG